MRILFLTPEVPHPPDSGGRLKTATLLNHLRAKHDLTVLCFRRRCLDPAQERWVDEFARVRTLPLNRGRDPRTLLRSYSSGVPLSIERNRVASMASMVEEEMGRGTFEAVFVDHWLMAQYLPQSFEGLRLLHEHNAEYVIWERQAKRSRNPLMKAEAGRVRRYEREIVSKFDRIFAVSEVDREALMDLGIAGGRVGILANIPDPALLRESPLRFEDTDPVIAYLGTLSWQPNIDGLQRFLAGVFPLVRERLPDARFLLAGRDAPPKLEALAKRTRGVEFLGDIDDPEALYRQAKVMLEATMTGGGTKLKVLNAMARGLPVVASEQAVEGLEARDGESILVARSDVLMAEAILRLIGDADLWQRLAESGRALVREKYVADVAFRPLDEALSRAAST